MAAMSSKSVRWFACLVVFGFTVHTGYSQNIKVEYFSSATLPCDNKDLNFTMNPSKQTGVVSKYWILPTGSLVDNTSTSDMVASNVYRWTVSEIFTNFNLTINRVNDDDFGMYICVVVYSNSSIEIVRRGLNLDGADFSKLEEKYKENAIIGGIAAACLFVVFSASCVIWQCRYSSREKRTQKEGVEKGDPAEKAFDNSAIEVEETNHL
ncbi:uncharacterized protein LOC133172950 [Saccostrea echinata]|uniref:uncharacterized protein LOC133172950 n=1 Tax=Saccostrea echinata TaxID=191078 RepID=UPI002A8131CC|nr:uncharacterized protein LOC133172950 [Saccostrea echinata]